MDNKKQPKPQELSAQELTEIAGGAAEYQPDKYPADSIYDTAKEAVSKRITDKVSGYPILRTKFEQVLSLKP